MSEIIDIEKTDLEMTDLAVEQQETVAQEGAVVQPEEAVEPTVADEQDAGQNGPDAGEELQAEGSAVDVAAESEVAEVAEVAEVVAERPQVIPTTENELKRYINKLRNGIDHHENLIKKAIFEAKNHRAGLADLKVKRDDINAGVRKSASEASKIRKERDEFNVVINGLKEERDGLRKEITTIAESIRELKTQRDDLNKGAKGSTLGLRRFYVLDVETLLNADIPLNHEKNMFDGIIDMHQRLDLSHKADDVHDEVTVTYKNLNALSKKSDQIHHRIQEIAAESQGKHEIMVEMYREIDKLRKDANNYHRQIEEKYAVIKPLSESIDANKVTIKKRRSDLGDCIDKMDDIHKDKLKGKQDKDTVVAKEKFKKTGKMSLDDLRLLIENNELEL